MVLNCQLMSLPPLYLKLQVENLGHLSPTFLPLPSCNLESKPVGTASPQLLQRAREERQERKEIASDSEFRFLSSSEHQEEGTESVQTVMGKGMAMGNSPE